MRLLGRDARMVGFWRGAVFGLLLLAPFPVRAQDEQEMFQLLTWCAAMNLEVTLDDGLFNLTIGQVEQAARSRLRAARLYRETSSYLLQVRVGVSGEAFGIDLYFYKPLRDSVSALSGLAITWFRTGVGTHANRADFVISSISQTMDDFLDRYLRVNEAFC